MITVECQPNDLDSIPFQTECDSCDNLKNTPEPGLFSWLILTAKHMEHEHQIILVGN